MNAAIHPMIHEEDGLPFIVCGIGSQSDQCHITRKEGYAYHQLIFSTQGNGILKINNQIFDIPEGTFFYLKPGESHEYYKTSESWATDWIIFKGDFIQSTLDKLGFSNSSIGSCYTVKTLVSDIIITLSGQDSLKGFTASSQFYKLLVELYRSSYYHLNKQHKQKTAIVEPVVNYIDSHFSEDMSLEELAKIANITPQYLCKVFKELIDMRPFEYIARKRIQESKKLLISSSISITDICKIVGYKDSSYFCSIFKKFESISPSEFRGNR